MMVPAITVASPSPPSPLSLQLSLLPYSITPSQHISDQFYVSSKFYPKNMTLIFFSNTLPFLHHLFLHSFTKLLQELHQSTSFWEFPRKLQPPGNSNNPDHAFTSINLLFLENFFCSH